MNSTPQIIYDTAISVARSSKCFQEKRFRLLSNKDLLDEAMESIFDMLGSTNNLIVALGAKSIEYNKDDLEYALFIAEKESEKSRKDYEKIIDDYSKQRLTFFLNNRSSFVTTMIPLITVLCYVLILEIFQLNKELILIPVMISIFGIANLTIYNIKLTKAWKNRSIILSSIYLIKSLTSRHS